MYSVHVFFFCFFFGHKSEEECRGEVLWPTPSHTNIQCKMLLGYSIKKLYTSINGVSKGGCLEL